MRRLYSQREIMLWAASAGAVGFVIDRVLKYLVMYQITGVSLFRETVRFSFSANPAMAFSLPVPGDVMRIISTLIFLIVAWIAWRSHQTFPARTGIFIFLLFGALSNLIDRYLFGFVVDYIDIIGRSLFNFADIMIGIGIFLVIFLRPEHFKNTNGIQTHN